MDASASLLDAARGGDRRALGRLITEVEDGTATGLAVLAELYPHGAGTWTTGITGAPGAGKSTLVDALVGEARAARRRVAVVAVDPSSPFTGGAVLGDRIRMQDHTADDDVLIRSMANRGSLGGIAESTPRAVAALAGLGFSEVIVETVGVGQSEVDVASAVDTTIVVLNPGWGDSVQAAKAGLLEIADVIVVNKADRPGADATVREVLGMLDVAPTPWPIPVLTTVGTRGVGIAELQSAIESHRRHLGSGAELARKRRMQAAAALRSAVVGLLRTAATPAEDDGGLIDRIVARGIDPWTAARLLLDGK
jgi:LAO/AO transport system kinase